MNRTRLSFLAIVAVAVLMASACGSDSSPRTTAGPPPITVEVKMADIAFTPKSLSVVRGQEVRFVFNNEGAIAHDAFIGDGAAQTDHEKEMREQDGKSGGMHHGGADSDAITVEPGDKGKLTHTFDKVGTIEIGCHQAGHYAAGMKLVIDVT